jgi:hypothetical protein
MIASAKDLAETSQQGADYQAQLLDFLVSNFLLGQSKPFPRPLNVNEPMRGVFQHLVAGTLFPEKTGIDPEF